MSEQTERLHVREFSDRGVQWLLESPENLRGLLRIVAADIANRVDFSRLQRIETTFIPDNLRKQEADLIFAAPFQDPESGVEREVLIYLLIEHQSTPDRAMGFRLLSYMVNLWDRQRRRWIDERRTESQWQLTPIVPVVFYTGSAGWAVELSVAELMDLPTGFERFVPRHDTLMLNLKATTPDALARDDHPLGWVLRVMQREDAALEEFRAALRQAVEHLERLPDEEQAAWTKLVYYLLLFVLHRRAPEEREELRRVVEESVQAHRRREEVKQMSKTAAEALIEEGKQLGLMEGKQEGLLELLREKFGELPPAVEEQVRATRDMEQLNAWLRAVLTAPRLEAMGLGRAGEKDTSSGSANAG